MVIGTYGCRMDSLLLVRQERVPIRATIWEFPAGQIDDASSRQMQIRSDGPA